jgi:hypothetical protein
VRFRVTYTRYAELRDDVAQQLARGGLLVKIGDTFDHDLAVTIELVMPDGVVLVGPAKVLQVLSGLGVAISVGDDLVAMARLASESGDDAGRSGDAIHARVDGAMPMPRTATQSRSGFDSKTPPFGTRPPFETRTPSHGSRTPSPGSRPPFESTTPAHGVKFESRTPSQGSRPPFESTTPSHGTRPPFESSTPSHGTRPPFESTTPAGGSSRPRSNPAIELPRTPTSSRPPETQRTPTGSRPIEGRAPTSSRGPYTGAIIETSRANTKRTDDRADTDAPSERSGRPSSDSERTARGSSGSERPARSSTESERLRGDVPPSSDSERRRGGSDAPPALESERRRGGSDPPAMESERRRGDSDAPPSSSSQRTPGLSRPPLSSSPGIAPLAASSSPAIEPPQPTTERPRATKPPYEDMTNAEKIQLALHGSRDERNTILRDKNRTLHPFVLKNPQVNLEDITTIAKNAQMGPEILKQISERREWFQQPGVATALARNPKTPPDIAIRALDYVPMDVLRQMAKGVGALPHVTQAARKKVIG